MCPPMVYTQKHTQKGAACVCLSACSSCYSCTVLPTFTFIPCVQHVMLACTAVLPNVPVRPSFLPSFLSHRALCVCLCARLYACATVWSPKTQLCCGNAVFGCSAWCPTLVSGHGCSWVVHSAQCSATQTPRSSFVCIVCALSWYAACLSSGVTICCYACSKTNVSRLGQDSAMCCKSSESKHSSI